MAPTGGGRLACARRGYERWVNSADHDEPRPPDLRVPITVDRLGPDLVVVAVRGDIDLHEAGELRAVLNDACAGPHRRVAVDLAGVHFMGSSGMGVIAEVHQHLAAEGRHLIVLEPSEAIRTACTIAGLAPVLEAVPVPDPA